MVGIGVDRRRIKIPPRPTGGRDTSVKTDQVQQETDHANAASADLNVEIVLEPIGPLKVVPELMAVEMVAV
jgi:hypothetical protein